MTPQTHIDLLAQQERLGKPFAGALLLHASVISVALFWSAVGGRAPERWGDPLATGGVVGVTPVANIPLPPRPGVINPVANDTVSQTPQAPPKAQPAKRVQEREDAIPIPGRETRKKQQAAASRRRQADTEERPSQLYSDAGRALVSPLLGKPGSGGVGVGSGTPLGDRFGAYAALLQRLVAERWNTGGVDSRLRTAPPVIVRFTILRDGTIRDVRLQTSSGNQALDLSALRAIYDLGKAPELPRAYEYNEAHIQFWFELKR